MFPEALELSFILPLLSIITFIVIIIYLVMQRIEHHKAFLTKIQKLKEALETQNAIIQEKDSNIKRLLEQKNSMYSDYSKELIKLKTESSEKQNKINELTNKFALYVKKQEAKLIEATKEARKDSIKRSRSTIRGQATEHLAPLTTDIWSHKDYRFIGNPIDYIVFAGASGVTDTTQDNIDEIIFLEIKTGKSKLNKVQRRIRDCIKNNRIYFAVYNPDTNELKREKNETY